MVEPRSVVLFLGLSPSGHHAIIFDDAHSLGPASLVSAHVTGQYDNIGLKPAYCASSGFAKGWIIEIFIRQLK